MASEPAMPSFSLLLAPDVACALKPVLDGSRASMVSVSAVMLAAFEDTPAADTRDIDRDRNANAGLLRSRCHRPPPIEELVSMRSAPHRRRRLCVARPMNACVSLSRMVTATAPASVMSPSLVLAFWSFSVCWLRSGSSRCRLRTRRRSRISPSPQRVVRRGVDAQAGREAFEPPSSDALVLLPTLTTATAAPPDLALASAVAVAVSVFVARNGDRRWPPVNWCR